MRLLTLPPSLLLLVLLLLASPLIGEGSAEAKDFDTVSAEAVKIPNSKGLTALFWSQEASCAALKNNLFRRQCEGVRAARRQKVVEHNYLIEVSGDAIQVGEVDGKAGAIDIALRACVACDAEGAIVVGKGAHKVNAGSIEALKLGGKRLKFKSVQHAEHWKKYISPRLRAQFLVGIPPKAERFKAAGRDGYEVSILGYRLYDPCKGQVILGKPASKKGPVDAGSCKAEPKLVIKEDKPAGPVEPQRPERLTTKQINTALSVVREAADDCFDAYQIAGMARFQLVITGEGTLSERKQTGDFVGTPTGMCLDEAMASATFPKTKKKETPISYPIILR